MYVYFALLPWITIRKQTSSDGPDYSESVLHVPCHVISNEMTFFIFLHIVLKVALFYTKNCSDSTFLHHFLRILGRIGAIILLSKKNCGISYSFLPSLIMLKSTFTKQKILENLIAWFLKCTRFFCTAVYIQLISKL
jgi:hypothetical protein